MRFAETDAPIADYDGHHIAVYVSNFSGPHAWLNEQGLITEESDAHQYRFQAIVDPDSGEVIAFNEVDQQLAESLASQAAVALTPGA